MMEDQNPAWKRSLRTHHSALRTGVVMGNVLPALRPLLTDVEYLSVENKEGDIARVDELVTILLTKDYSVFDGLCSALERNGYPDWASKLKGEGIASTVPNKAQWQIQFPIIDDLSTEFALLAAKIDTAVHGLTSNRLRALKTCVAVKLKCKDSDWQGFISSAADELMSALYQYWDFLNFEFAQLVVKCLEDERLQKEMRSYEEHVQAKVVATLQECKKRDIHPEPPPNCVSLSITVNVDPHSYSLHRILQMKDFLVHQIGLDMALFAGWMNGSIKLYFYIGAGDIAVAELVSNKHLEELQSLQVTKLEVFDRFCLDVLSGESVKATLGSSGVKGSIQELRGRHKEEKEEVMDTQGSKLFSGLPQPEHCLETVVMGEESPMWSLFVQIGDGSTATINAPRDKLLNMTVKEFKAVVRERIILREFNLMFAGELLVDAKQLQHYHEEYCLCNQSTVFLIVVVPGV